MFKRGKSKFIFSIGISEIFLLISMSFALSFILEENLVSGQEPFSSELPSPELRASDLFRIPSNIQSPTLSSGRLIPPNLPDKPITVAERGPYEFVTDLFKGKAFGNPAAQGGVTKLVGIGNTLVGALAWAGVAYVAGQLLGSLLGLEDEQKNALSNALAGGAFTYAGLEFAVTNKLLTPGDFLFTGGFNFLAGVGIAAAIFIATYKTEKKKLVKFQCLPFEPPLKGEHCEDCNKDPFRPCSEYRCRALGQACQLLNPGTAEEKCAWVNPKDVTSPTIESWTEALKPRGLAYVPDNVIRPPNRGVKIVKGGGNGCIEAFTPLEFGIVTNEPAQCKIDYLLTKTLDEMKFFIGGSNYYRYNHTQKMKLPGPNTGEQGELAPELKNDGSFSLFVRCRDANGNENVDAFVFNLCIDQSPDTTPPIIEGTSIVQGGFVRFNADIVPIEAYVNEPAECKWSRQSKNYDDMENKMECDIETFQINANLNYACRGNLTGIKNNEENKFYFRCKDQPNKAENERNVMVQSHELILKGSQPLNILNVEPNGTIFGSTDTVTIELTAKTDDGAEEGKSICYFSNTDKIDSFIAMFQTNGFEHRQKLDLIPGNYEYFFRCIDLGGNTAEDKTTFSVFVDKEFPKVTRAYREEGLKIVTNEDAECVYALTSCNYLFDEGLPLIYSNPSIKRNHFAEWNPSSVYYIKCKDLYGNQPSPNECSIIVNAIELASKI